MTGILKAKAEEGLLLTTYGGRERKMIMVN